MFAHIFKTNPYHDAQGRFTSKEKAVHQHDKLGEMAQEFIKTYGNFPDFMGVITSSAAKPKLDAMAAMYNKYAKNSQGSTGPVKSPFEIFDHALPGDGIKASFMATKVKALAAGQKAKQSKLAKTTGASQPEPPKPAVNMIPVAGGDNSKSAKSKQAWKKIYMGKSLKAMPDAVDQYLQQAKAVSDAPNAYIKKKEQAKLDAMQKKLAFLQDQYVSNGGDQAHYQDLVVKATNAAIQKMGSMPPMTAVPPVSASNTGKTKVVVYAPNSTKSAELLQNQMLGVQYYTLRDQLGKDHPDTQKAYGEWQKSKDSLKTLDPGIDIPGLSMKAKQQWEQQKMATTPPPAPPPVKASIGSLTTTTSKIKDAFSHAYAVAYNTEMGNSGAVANASTMLASLSADIMKSSPSAKAMLDEAIDKASDMAVTAAKASAYAKPLPSGTYHEIQGKYSAYQPATKVAADYKAHSAAQSNLLSSGEKNAVMEYTGSGFSEINKAAVYGTQSFLVKESLKNLESAIDKVTLGENLTLYRTAPSKWFLQAMGLGESNSDVTPGDLKATVGKVYVERAFSSTTRNSSFTSSYTKTVDKSGRVRFVIRAPSTAKALETSLNDLSGNGGEQEVILQRNSMLYVRKVSKNAQEITVEVDLVGVHHD